MLQQIIAKKHKFYQFSINNVSMQKKKKKNIQLLGVYIDFKGFIRDSGTSTVCIRSYCNYVILKLYHNCQPSKSKIKINVEN